MPLPVFDTKDAVPEPFRSEYEERDGKWHPKAIADDLGEKGKEALSKEREARKREKERADAAERERDELKRTAEAHEKGITKEQLDKIKADEAAARKPIEEERDRIKAENRKLKLTDRLTAKMLAMGIMPDRIEKALKDVEGARVDLTEDGADFVVKDAKGNITTESLDDFLSKTYKKEAPFFYKGPGGSGSGAEQDAGGGGSGYDPVAEGKKAAQVQKQAATDNALAFK